MKKTAVSKSPLLLVIMLVPLLCLSWVTQLLAQTEPLRPSDFIIIDSEPVGNEVAGTDSYRLQFVGLISTSGQFQDVSYLEVVPAKPDEGIEVINSALYTITKVVMPASLADENFYISLLVDTSGSMVLTNSVAISGNLTLVQEQLVAALSASTSLSNAYFSVAGFNGQIRPEQFTAFTNDKTAIINQIRQLQSENGSTCLDDVVFTAVQSLANLPQNSRRAIILFTDGVDEVTRGQPERCSQNYTFDQAVNLASVLSQTVAIPIHTVNYPYLTQINHLTSDNTILTGLSLEGESFTSNQFQTIIDSFTHQWAAAIELYTPSGTHALQITPYLPDGTPLEPQLLTYTAQFEHYPAALAKSLALDDVVYHETTNTFAINLRLCPPELLAMETAVPYCKPEQTQAIDVLIEDLFTHEIIPVVPTGQFRLDSEPQTIYTEAYLKAEHYYLIRVTAKNGVTSANYHPNAEAIFAYQPALKETEVSIVGTPRLDGLKLYPDLIVSLRAARSHLGGVKADPSLLVNGRHLFSAVDTQHPVTITVGGYLLYTGDDSRDELYPLVPQSVAYSPALTVTFPNAAGGGYADYDLYLTVNDMRDGVGTTLPVIDQLKPGSWYGRALRQVRQVLADPLPYVAAILLMLLFLGLIWLVVWLARRTIKPETTAPAIIRTPDPVPAQIYVDASPDETVHRQRYDLPVERPFRIGRDYESELSIRADENMADLHAKIEKLDKYFYITSCDRKHPTYVNNEEIITDAPLRIHNGDKIRLGPHTRFTFTAPQEAKEMKENGHGLNR